MRIPQIQALRALAAILVVLFHAKAVPGGYIGVDIFYVISGYLITGLLVSEMERTGSVSLKSFYIRRIKRLLPTSFVVLISTALISWFLFPLTMRAELGKYVIAASTYLSNFLFAFWQTDYQNLNAVPPVVIHYWSLAVEEQFYLFWPIFIWLLFRAGGRNRVRAGVAIATSLSFILSLYLTATSPIWAFYSLPTRAWELGAGALLIFLPTRFHFGKIYLWFGLALAAFGSFAFNDATPFPGRAALVPVFATVALLGSVKAWPRLIDIPANWPVTQWLGEISYPLYLWHWPALVIPAIYLGRGLHIYERALAVLVTLALADLTHRVVEQPLRKASIKPRVVMISAVAMTITSLIVGLAISNANSKSISVTGIGKVSLAQMSARPIVYDDGCHVNNGQDKSPECAYGDLSSSKVVVLFGDSHAAQWFPALEKLAKERSFKLISLTKSACPGPAVAKVETGAYKNADCSAWRKNSFNRIRALQPRAIFLSGFQYFQLPSGYSDRGTWWREGEQKTLAGLQGSSPFIYYISDTPHPNRDIPSCIAAGKLDRCNGSEKSPAFFIPGYTPINPSGWLCSRSCPAIVAGTVAYRDSSHIGVAISRLLSTKFEPFLAQAGL